MPENTRDSGVPDRASVLVFFEYERTPAEWMPDPNGKVVPFGHTHEESQQSL